MSQEIINTKTNSGSGNTVLTTTRGSEPRSNKDIKTLGRNSLERIHSNPEEVTNDDLSKTAVGKGFQIASSGIKDSVNSGLNILHSASSSAIDTVKSNIENRNIKSIIFGLLGAGFGLSTIKGLFSAPKVISKRDKDQQQAPMLLKGAQWLAGGTIALGALKALTTGAGISNPALILGVLVFIALNTLISGYEKENSIAGNVLNVLGLKDKVKEIADDLKIGKVMPD